jgi:hypothetical protein
VASNVESRAVAAGSGLAVATVSPCRLANWRVVPVVESWMAARSEPRALMLRVQWVAVGSSAIHEGLSVSSA